MHYPRGPTPAFSRDLEDRMGTQAVVLQSGATAAPGTALETAGPRDRWRASVFINRLK